MGWGKLKVIESRRQAEHKSKRLSRLNWGPTLKELLARMIAAVIPLAALTFSTYQFDPRPAINVTAGETEFLFNEAARKYHFYVFDFFTGQDSDVGDSGAQYASTLAGWMASDPARVGRFHEFAALFHRLLIGPDLLNVLRLWQLGSGEHPDLHPAVLLEAVRFAGAERGPKRPPQCWPHAAMSSPRSTNRPPSRMGRSGPVRRDRRTLETRDDADRRRACEAWVASFDAIVVVTT